MGNLYSDNTCSDSQFISTYLTHPLRKSISQISDIVRIAPNACCIKNADDGKYLLSNQYMTELCGFEPDECIGLTVDDLPYGFCDGGKAAMSSTVKELDEKAKTDCAPQFHQVFILTHQGFVMLRNMVKVSVIGQRYNKVLAVLTYEEDLTYRCNLFDLFKVYQKHYVPKQAIKKFLSYLEVDTYFREIPTNAEVHTLIAMLRNPHHKKVARLLNISHKTIAHHSYLLKSKLKEDKTLDDVVEEMRDKWVPIVNGYRYYQ